MYIPKHFEISDANVIDGFIEANSFGQLASLHDGTITASHLPFLYVEQDRKLIGHLARANPQWQQIDGQKVLVVLQGEHAYVSPSWYESKGVPTWNYQAVHIEGMAQAFTDEERLKRLVDSLTAQNEAGYPQPWKPDYAATMLRGIVGIEIAITSVRCKFKVSQNRSKEDQKNVRKKLDLAGHKSLAAAISEGEY